MAEKITHTEDEWRVHLNLIARLYVAEHWTHEDIAEHLATLGFSASAFTVKKWLLKWRITRLNQQDELKLMASHCLYHRQLGQSVTFRRFGEEFPLDKVDEFLQRNPSTQPSGKPLPEYLQSLVQNLQPPRENPPNESHGHDHDSLGTSSLLMRDISLSEHVNDDRSRKRRRLDTSSSRTRFNQCSQSQQDEVDSGRSASDTQNNGNNGNADQDLVVDEAQGADSTQPAASNLLEKKAVVIVKQEEEETTDLGPLHCAASCNNLKILELLIQHGADVNARGGDGSTALHIAAAEDHFETLKYLVLQDGADLDAVDHEQCTALVRAIRANSLRCALLLVRSGANVDLPTDKGMTALHYACKKENMHSLVTQLLAKTSDVNSKTKYKVTPLHLAIDAEEWDYVMPLIEAGADLDAQDKHGWTPMHKACPQASAELLMKMVDNDVDLSIKDKDDDTVLHLLCERDISDVVEAALMKDNVDINARNDKGSTPLIVAAYENNIATVKLLIQHGADKAVLDFDLDTALTAAIERGHDEIAQFLINSGSPVNPQNRSLTRYKAELEHDRKTREADSFLTMIADRPQGTQRNQISSKARSHRKNSFISQKTSSQSLQSVQPWLNMAVGQAVNHVLAQSGFTQHRPMESPLNIIGSGGSQLPHGNTTAGNFFFETADSPDSRFLRSFITDEFFSGGDNSGMGMNIG